MTKHLLGEYQLKKHRTVVMRKGSMVEFSVQQQIKSTPLPMRTSVGQ